MHKKLDTRENEYEDFTRRGIARSGKNGVGSNWRFLEKTQNGPKASGKKRSVPLG